MIALSCGDEISIALALKDADGSCTGELLSELESVEIVLSHEGETARSCISIAAVTTFDELEAALAASGVAFRELEPGAGGIDLRGFEEPGCADVSLCGAASYRLPRDREIAIPLGCGGCE